MPIFKNNRQNTIIHIVILLTVFIIGIIIGNFRFNTLKKEKHNLSDSSANKPDLIFDYHVDYQWQEEFLNLAKEIRTYFLFIQPSNELSEELFSATANDSITRKLLHRIPPNKRLLSTNELQNARKTSVINDEKIDSVTMHKFIPSKFLLSMKEQRLVELQLALKTISDAISGEYLPLDWSLSKINKIKLDIPRYELKIDSMLKTNRNTNAKIIEY